MSYALLGWDSDKNKIEVFIDDRLYHTYLVGSTGYGKTSLITQLVLQDAKLRSPKQGLLVLDPLGGLVDNILHYLPKDRLDDVVLLQLDSKYPVWGMNLYECPDITNQGEVDKAMERVMRVWNKIFSITPQTPLLETLMRNLSYAIIFNPPYTMLEIPRFLRDKAFRQQLTANIPFEEVRWFWEDFETLSKHDYREQVDAVRRRFDGFLIPTFKPIIGQYKSTINFVKLMNEGKIVLVKMNPELPSASQLMGSILTSLLLMAAYARPIGERKQFNLYVDEFQQFAGKEFAILYENARQFKLGALVSQQHRSQIPPELSDLAESLMQASTFITLQTTPATARELSAKFDSTAAEPKMEEAGMRNKKRPVANIIEHVARVEHESPAVNKFATYVARLYNRPQEVSHARMLYQINTLLSAAMTNKPITKDILIAGTAPFFMMHPAPEEFLKWFETGDASEYHRILTYPRAVEQVLYLVKGEFWRIEQLRSPDFDRYEADKKKTRWHVLYPRMTAEEVIAYYRLHGPLIETKDPIWFHIDIEKIIWRDEEGILKVANKPEEFYTQEEFEQAVPFVYEKLKQQVEEQMVYIKEVLQGLRDHPILGDSGEEEPILRPGQKDTPDQIRDKITNEIIHLETGHARVRLKQEPINLKTKVCHRCGKVHPITGEIKDGKKHVTFLPDVCEECKIPIRTEYLITLAQPEDEKDKDGKPKFPRAPDIEPRVKWIIENNLRLGYLRKREDVEKEIAARQQAFTSPQPAPIATEKTPPKQPPTPPPMKRQNKII